MPQIANYHIINFQGETSQYKMTSSQSSKINKQRFEEKKTIGDTNKKGKDGGDKQIY